MKYPLSVSNKTIFVALSFLVLFFSTPSFSQNTQGTDQGTSADSLEKVRQKAKTLLDEIFMFDIAKDVIETRELIRDKALGDTVQKYIEKYDNALFFISELDYDFCWNRVLGRKKYRVPSGKFPLDSKEEYIAKNDPASSIDFDIVLTPNWVDPAKKDKVKNYTVKITAGNYTNLSFTSDQKNDLDTALNSKLTENPNTPKNAKVNEAIFEGLKQLRTLLKEADKPVNLKLNLDFSAHQNQAYGFDKLIYDVHKPSYIQKTLNGKKVYLPWKSMASSGFDKIIVEITDNDSNYSPSDVKFKTSGGTKVTATKFQGKDNMFELNLTGKTDEEVEELIAYIDYQIDANNSKEVHIGAVNTIAYDKQNVNLVIVPVNEPSPFSATKFADELNAIYKQAVVNWNVTLDDVFNIDQEVWDKNNDGKLNDGESTLLSNYSDEQNAFKHKYKKDRTIDKKTYYVFLLNNIPSKSGLLGYMPLKSQYAFIHSANNENAAQLIAHELGHGAFRLWHTFSSESNYFMAENTSDNLMDYKKGTRLHKYQWDFIHNPEGGLYLFQDESEGAMEIIDFDYSSNGYGGSEAVLNNIFKHKDDIIAIVKDFGLPLTPDVAAKVLIAHYGNIEILNNQEAYSYLVNLLKYDRLSQIANNKTKLIEALGKETDKQKILDIIRKNIDTETDLAIDLSSETFEFVAHLRDIYNVSKDIPIDELKSLLPRYLNSYGKKELLLTLSNTKFKEVLRNRGITKNSDIQELLNLKNTKNSNYFTDSRIINITEGLGENQITKLLDNTSDLGIISVAKKKGNLTSSIFDNSIKFKNISNVLEITGYAVDLAIAFKNIANGQDLEPADLLFMFPGAPELVKSLINNMAIESFVWENELPWRVIKKWNIVDQSGKTEQDRFGIPGHLYLQYTQYKGKTNPNILPTSFVFLDLNTANEVFGFNPEFVNYNNETGFSSNGFSPQAQSDKIVW